MRSTGIFIVAISLALLVLGCVPSSPDTKAKMDDAKKKISDAADATAEAAKAKRDDYAREMQKRLDELNVKYEELKGRAAKADDQARKDLEKRLEEAKVKRDAAASKLDELKEAGADRWEKVKEGVGNALDDLKKVFD
jgi:Skp family chaperone for outer membrane proteins